MSCPSTSQILTIQPTECIGNSLNTINTNFTNLRLAACDNQTQITTLNSLLVNNIYAMNLIKGFTYSYTNSTTLTIAPGVAVLNDLTTVVTSTNTLSLNYNTVGANGFETAANNYTFYYLYIIFNPSINNLAAFASTNTVPTLPSGYTKYRLIGCFSTRSTSFRGFLMSGNFNDRQIFYNDAGDYRNVASGAAGTPGSWTTSFINGGSNAAIPDIANLVFLGEKQEPVSTGSFGWQAGYTVDMSHVVAANNSFIKSVLLSFIGISLAGAETVYSIGVNFSGINNYILATNNYNGVSNGDYDNSGEIPIGSSTNLIVSYTQNASINQKLEQYIKIYCNGLKFTI